MSVVQEREHQTRCAVCDKQVDASTCAHGLRSGEYVDLCDCECVAAHFMGTERRSDEEIRKRDREKARDSVVAAAALWADALNRLDQANERRDEFMLTDEEDMAAKRARAEAAAGYKHMVDTLRAKVGAFWQFDEVPF